MPRTWLRYGVDEVVMSVGEFVVMRWLSDGGTTHPLSLQVRAGGKRDVHHIVRYIENCRLIKATRPERLPRFSFCKAGLTLFFYGGGVSTTSGDHQYLLAEYWFLP
jgi:hypothetical protein